MLLQDRVRAATAEQRAERSQGSRDPMHLLRVRYFEMPEAKRGNAEREAAPQPGQISAELAAALGAHAVAWLAFAAINL